MPCTHGAYRYRVTCGACGQRWCERCDPAPSALCHVCHGRGYTHAPLGHVKFEADRPVRVTRLRGRRDDNPMAGPAFEGALVKEPHVGNALRVLRFHPEALFITTAVQEMTWRDGRLFVSTANSHYCLEPLPVPGMEET